MDIGIAYKTVVQHYDLDNPDPKTVGIPKYLYSVVGLEDTKEFMYECIIEGLGYEIRYQRRSAKFDYNNIVTRTLDNSM